MDYEDEAEARGWGRATTYRPCSCEWCGRTFENTKGRSNHKRSCMNRPDGWVYGEESDDAQSQEPAPKVNFF